MRKTIFVFAALATVALCGCNYSDQQRHAQEYERFLKQTLGTAEPAASRAPQHAAAAAAPDARVD